jgi:amino acid transporter
MTISSADNNDRHLGLWSACAVVIGCTIGSGIFRSQAEIAEILPARVPFVSVWAIAGALALCGSLTYAELGTAFPSDGGVYVFLREGWGRLPAFLFGWAELIVIRAAGVGAHATLVAEYSLRMIGLDPEKAPNDTYVHYIAAAAIAAAGYCNYVGVKWAVLLQNTTTLIKLGGLFAIIVMALTFAAPAAGAQAEPVAAPQGWSFGALSLALIPVLWTYDGWADLTFRTGEVKYPGKNLPRALIYGLVIVIFAYLLANLSYLKVLTIDEIRQSKLVAATVAEKAIGHAGVILVSVTIVISTFGTLNGVLLTAPGIFSTMAEDGLLFREIAAKHPRYKTPHHAIVLTAGLGIIFVLIQTFEGLTDAFITAIVPFYGLAAASVFRLRRRPRAAYSPSFMTPLYPWLPAAFICAMAWIIINSLFDPKSRLGTTGVLVLIAIGIPVFYLTVGQRRTPPTPPSRPGIPDQDLPPSL